MKQSERKQLRLNSPPPMTPLEQITFEDIRQLTYICPFCCCSLGIDIKRLPDNCPDCGQPIQKARK